MENVVLISWGSVLTQMLKRWRRMGSWQMAGRSLVALVTLFIFVTQTPLAHAQTSEASLQELIENIKRSQPEADAAVLRNELDGLALDKESLPAKDPKTGALNILGETPRDKLVTEFVEGVVAYAKTVGEASSAQYKSVQLLRETQGQARAIAIRFLTEAPQAPSSQAVSPTSSTSPTSGDRATTQPLWQPLKLRMSLGEQSSGEIQYLPGLEENRGPVTLAATVLSVGRHRIRFQGVAAAWTAQGVGRIGALRDAQPFDQTLELMVNAAPGNGPQGEQTFDFAIRNSPRGLLIESKGGDESKK